MSNLLVYAGPNGSGKSTITTQFRAIGQYVNADEIKKKNEGCHISDSLFYFILAINKNILYNNNVDFNINSFSLMGCLVSIKEKQHTIRNVVLQYVLLLSLIVDV